LGRLLIASGPFFFLEIWRSSSKTGGAEAAAE
jgi:hypothetical protein